MILALDTSTAYASAALFDGEALRAETSWETGTAATAQLLVVVEHLMRLADCRPADLRGIAVALGPGSFNGLRVALSLGKGLASALGLPIVGFPTPDIAAYPFSSLVLPVCAILKAGRNRLICTRFQTRYGRWQRVSDFRNLTLEALIEETDRTTVFCGEIDREMAAALQERLGRHALLASAALSARRAGYLAEMAWRRLEEDPKGDDLVALEPLYLSLPRLGGTGAAREEED